ncbi:hypothetical protein HOB87_02760 [Candidatus Woesearchaeota archaeon]|jgi:hypothetical protein|nr:hypothetical protein [Candidatus Woesearchaeota archaeon]
MGIDFHSLNGTTDEDGDATVIGLISNDGSKRLNLTVEVTFFDGDEYLGHGTDYIQVPPGGKRPFEVTSYDTPMSRFEISAYE